MTMRIDLAVWPADYGSPVTDDVPGTTTVPVDYDCEVGQAQWRPITPTPPTVRAVTFVDGVRRMEARAWLTPDGGTTVPGLVGSWAAGAIRCDGRAAIVDTRVERGLFSSAPDRPGIEAPGGLVFRACESRSDSDDGLRNALQSRMRDLELEVAAGLAGQDGLVVLDGPLRRRLPGRAVGYVKTQHVDYLSEALRPTVAALRVGERTPLLVLATRDLKHWSWYLRLADVGSHPWEAVVRCETPVDDIDRDAARTLADEVTALLPRFASSPHRDVRAPQNLYPIGALERHLRRRLGSAEVVARRLRRATHEPARTAEPAGR